MSGIKWVVAVAMGLALTTAAWAQDRPRERPRGDRPAGDRVRADRPAAERPPADRPAPRRDGAIDPKVALERLTNALGLTEEQQAQVKQILETHAQAVENWQKEHQAEARALREEMAKAREAGDEAKMKELAEKGKALADGRRKLQDGLHDQIAAVLTDEQKAKWAKDRPGDRPGPIAIRLRPLLGQLGLTDEQAPQVRKIYQAAEEAAKAAEGPEAKAAIFRKANEDVMALLTDEQKAKLRQLLAGPGPEGPPPMKRPFAELGLSEEQQKQVQTIMQEARVKAKDAAPEERAEIQRAAFEKVLTEVLTEEQRAKAKELRQDRAGEHKRPAAPPAAE